MKRLLVTVSALLLAVGGLGAATPAASGRGFVTRDGSDLRLDGRPFGFAGTNTRRSSSPARRRR